MSFAPFPLYFAFSLAGGNILFHMEPEEQGGLQNKENERKYKNTMLTPFVSVFRRTGRERDAETENYPIKRSFGLKILFLKLLHHSLGRSKKVGWRNDPAKQLEYIMTSRAGNESSLVINFDFSNFK
jgi:hypothetical protein